MTSKLIALIETELPELFESPENVGYFRSIDLNRQESLIENFFTLHYPHENQLEKRNKFRNAWNQILLAMDKVESIFGKQEKRKVECNHLKPCPFCNGEALLSGLYPLGQYYIQCLDCRVSLWDDRQDKAIGHWNMRDGKN